MKLFYSVVIFFSLSSLVFAQEELPQIELSDFPDITINRTEYYNGSSLWGYIDGGADLYLEYGFSKLVAQEVLFQSVKYRVDVYKMKNAEAAFGIFSISKFKCSSKSICKYSCITDYQALAAKGSYYISIINEKGSTEEQKFTQSLAEKILSRIKEADYTIPQLFASGPFQHNIKFINGILGVQNSIADMEEMFSDLKDFKIHISTVEEGEEYITLASVKFSNPSDASIFFGRKDKRAAGLPKGTAFQLKKETEDTVVLLETNKPKEDKIFSIFK